MHGRSIAIQGRDCALDVGEIGDEFPVLIGQIPLESLDWVVDTKNQQLIGNPDHHGEWGIERVLIELFDPRSSN